MIANKLFGKMLSQIKSAMGLHPLEQMASKAGMPLNLMSPDMGRKHKGTMDKTMPGIMAASMRFGERPVGGKMEGVAPRPLFNKRGS